MNKTNWVSIILDAIDQKSFKELLDISWELTKLKGRNHTNPRCSSGHIVIIHALRNAIHVSEPMILTRQERLIINFPEYCRSYSR